MFEASVRALEQLISNGLFGSEVQRNKLFILFSLNDSSTFKTHEPDWVKRLNTSEVEAKYNSWRNTLKNG